MKLNKRRLMMLLSALMLSLMVGITCLLFSAYQHFVRETEKLLEIKEDYATYVLSLKRMMLECDVPQAADAIDEGSDEKKKLITDNEEPFLVVNREPEYLKSSMLAFAKEHKVEQAVQKMYDHNPVITGHAKRAPRKPQAARKRNQSSKTDSKKRKPQEASSRLRRTHSRALSKSGELSLAWPIEKDTFWLSSGFGPRKKEDGSWGFHHGIDMAACKGTPVKSAETGVVTEARYASGYGNLVVVAHNRKYSTRYAHLSRILVNAGDHVECGQIIGKVGATGYTRKSKKGTDSSHLHFEVVVFGKRVNPFYFLT